MTPALADLPVPAHDPDSIRAEAERIVAEELVDDRSGVQRLLDTARRGLGDFLGDLFGGVGEGTGAAGLVVTALLVLAIVAVFALAVRALVRAQRSRVAPGPTDGVSVVLGQAVRPVALHDEIRAAEARGDWAAVVMARFRLCVAGLIRERTLSDVVGRTTGEYRGEVAEARPHLADDFSAASRVFERAYYGREPMTEAEAAEMSLRTAALVGDGGPAS